MWFTVYLYVVLAEPGDDGDDVDGCQEACCGAGCGREGEAEYWVVREYCAAASLCTGWVYDKAYTLG